METQALHVHLSNWLALELQELPFHQQSQTVLCPANYCFANSLILSSLNPEYFTGCRSIILEIKDYLLREMHIHLSLQLCGQSTDDQVTRLAIYICLHSGQRKNYITRIITKMAEADQQNIMKDIQKLEQQLEVIKEVEHFWRTIGELDDQNQRILKELHSLEEKYQACELDKLEAIHERDQIVLEKRKILSKFKLSNMAEYQELCEQLRIENEESSHHFKQIQNIIKNLNLQKSQLEIFLKERDNAFFELTNDFNDLKVQHNQCLQELEQYQNDWAQNIESMCSKVCSHLGSTGCETIQETVQQARNLQEFKPAESFNASSSGFSFSKTHTSMATTQSIFRMTKNNLTLCEKLQNSEEQIEQLKARIFSMEDEMKDIQFRDKKKLKKLRKVEKLFDPFWDKFQSLSKQNQTVSQKL